MNERQISIFYLRLLFVKNYSLLFEKLLHSIILQSDSKISNFIGESHKNSIFDLHDLFLFSWAHENNFEKNVKSYYSLPIMLFLYWDEHNASIIHLFQNELPIFNEESGEIIFSILAKIISSISKHEFRKLSQFYTMINCYQASQLAFFGDIFLSSDDFYI